MLRMGLLACRVSRLFGVVVVLVVFGSEVWVLAVLID